MQLFVRRREGSQFVKAIKEVQRGIPPHEGEVFKVQADGSNAVRRLLHRLLGLHDCIDHLPVFRHLPCFLHHAFRPHVLVGVLQGPGVDDGQNEK
ncbi:MAG: hypothetical protein R3F13_19025 [Prosthecobacter sp.]